MGGLGTARQVSNGCSGGGRERGLGGGARDRARRVRGRVPQVAAAVVSVGVEVRQVLVVDEIIEQVGGGGSARRVGVVVIRQVREVVIEDDPREGHVVGNRVRAARPVELGR